MLSKTALKRSGEYIEVCRSHSKTGINKNRITPEIRCKIDALAVGELLTLITWLSGRLIGRLLFTAGVLLRLTLVITLLRPFTY